MSLRISAARFRVGCFLILDRRKVARMGWRSSYGALFLSFLMSSLIVIIFYSDVTFDYPESKCNQSALNKVSFSIPAGQLVVIVGVNGSGKSTLVKLLAHLYEATSGDVLIDGHQIQKYQVPHLRKATAVLAQEHSLFPLTVSENIGLGDPRYLSDSERLAESAKLGGSYDFIMKLADGFDSILQPIQTGYSHNVSKEENSTLLSEYEKVEKSVELSGGEKQRLIA
jgi:ABC-type multidrug transport system fused ATPase/permease subunit